MARKSRLFIPGMPHLVQLNGHNGERLFRDDADYTLFLDYQRSTAARYHIDIYAWALAERRILLLLGAPDKDALSRFIQHLGRRYVPYYNHRYQRHGALWEQRYQSSPLEPEAYFLLVKKFVECEEDGISGRHSQGGQFTSGLSEYPLWLQLGPDDSQRQATYRRFCQSPANPALQARIQMALEQNCLLATPAFNQRLENQLERPLKARSSGRPRKQEDNPIEQWSWLERQACHLLQQWGYQQIRLRMLEQQPPFSAGGLRVKGDSELRTNGTAGCLRLLAEEGRLPAASRLWYCGAMFCQSGQSSHLDQLHQVGVEAFGMADTDIELEQLMMQASFFNQLGLAGHVELHINTLGDAATLARFRQALFDYYHPLAHLLSPEQQATLAHHPEQLIYQEDVLLQRLAHGAPQLEDFLQPAAIARLRQLQHGLSAAGIPWQYLPHLFPENPYCQLVFEWRSADPGNGSVLCRGGRYDSCASAATGRAVYACGFAFMLEAIMELIAHLQQRDNTRRRVDVAIIASQSRAAGLALLLGRRLRQQFPQLAIINDCSTQRLTTRVKNARRLGARFIITLEGEGTTVLLQDTRSLISRPVSLDTVADLLAVKLQG